VEDACARQADALPQTFRRCRAGDDGFPDRWSRANVSKNRSHRGIADRKTAKAFGRTIPQSLLVRADRVVE